MEPKFEVSGDKIILNDVKINIETVRQEEYPHEEVKIETLLYNGVIYTVQNNNVSQWKIYLSYRDSLVTCLSVENIMWPVSDHINKLYVQRINNQLSIKYIGRESDIKLQQGFSETVMEINEYITKQNMKNESDKNDIKKKFFNFYNPSLQTFKRIN